MTPTQKLTRFSLRLALLGFILAWALLAACTCSHHAADCCFSHSAWLLALCPPSIISISLDDASPAVGLFWWFVISVANALLYGLIGVLVFVTSQPKRKG